MVRTHLKNLVLAGATSRSATRILAPLTRGTATILMLHRFAEASRDVSGHDPAKLRTLLEHLRRMPCVILSLAEVFARCARRERFDPLTVAFTLDDGYFDQAEVAAPLFAEFDCPATIFITTGFLDGALWFWWDKIAHVFGATPRPSIALHLPSGRSTYDLSTLETRSRATQHFTSLCKALPDVDKNAAIHTLSLEANVEIPIGPPPRYGPMSWAQVCELERRGISFGPHTVTHPILSRTNDDQARHEVVESWRRLQTEARTPVPVFCYPNGQPADFGPREILNLRQTGLRGAVTGTPGFVRVASTDPDDEFPFRVPRFAYHDDRRSTLQYLNGFEHLKQRLVGIG